VNTSSTANKTDGQSDRAMLNKICFSRTIRRMAIIAETTRHTENSTASNGQ